MFPRVPDDHEHRTISRLHCLIDVNPPDIRIRDMGSKFGTFVNGVRIGQRERDEQRGQGTFFFTLEYCSGGSADRLPRQRDNPLPIDEACSMIRQVLIGLEYVHNTELSVDLPDGSTAQARGLVHRDLKPSNIFLTGTGASQVAKVGDYGLAKAFDLASLSGLTMTGDRAGTMAFMPRQQVINFKKAKSEVDVWAAASLYFLLTGRFPRHFPDDEDPIQVVLRTQRTPIREHNPAIPSRLAKLLDETLIDNPRIIFRTAEEFRQALERVL
jgi:eukaryotic-like serine/threonine-protein kinase